MTPAHVADCAALIAERDILMTQFEAPPETVASARSLAKAQGALTILNPAPARPVDPKVLANADVLTPNAIEARALLSLPPDADVADVDLGRQLLGYGAGSVVITQVERGALIVDSVGAAQILALPIQAVDVAGDSFNAALAVCLGEGMELDSAARVAVRAGAYGAMRLGVIAGLPTRAQLDAFA